MARVAPGPGEHPDATPGVHLSTIASPRRRTSSAGTTGGRYGTNRGMGGFYVRQSRHDGRARGQPERGRTADRNDDAHRPAVDRERITSRQARWGSLACRVCRVRRVLGRMRARSDPRAAMRHQRRSITAVHRQPRRDRPAHPPNLRRSRDRRHRAADGRRPERWTSWTSLPWSRPPGPPARMPSTRVSVSSRRTPRSPRPWKQRDRCGSGRPPSAIRAMGDKAAARQLAPLGVPIVPGYDGADQSDAALARAADRSATRCS